MSSFSSRTQDTIPHPGEEPNTITIRKLAGRHLERASQASQFASADRLKGMGGVAFQRELGSLGDPVETAALVAKAQADPLNTYDRYVVLYKGIVSWTCGESLTPTEVVADNGDKELRILAIDDLDKETVETVARAILALTLPATDPAAKKKD